MLSSVDSGLIDDEFTVLMRVPEHVFKLTNWCYNMLSNIWEIHDKSNFQELMDRGARMWLPQN